MRKPTKSNKSVTANKAKPKKRRLGISKLGIVEVVPWAVADAEIEKLFEESKLFPDED